jgi:hypothetical protein
MLVLAASWSPEKAEGSNSRKWRAIRPPTLFSAEMDQVSDGKDRTYTSFETAGRCIAE